MIKFTDLLAPGKRPNMAILESIESAARAIHAQSLIISRGLNESVRSCMLSDYLTGEAVIPGVDPQYLAENSQHIGDMLGKIAVLSANLTPGGSVIRSVNPGSDIVEKEVDDPREAIEEIRTMLRAIKRLSDRIENRLVVVINGDNVPYGAIDARLDAIDRAYGETKYGNPARYRIPYVGDEPKAEGASVEGGAPDALTPEPSPDMPILPRLTIADLIGLRKESAESTSPKLNESEDDKDTNTKHPSNFSSTEVKRTADVVGNLRRAKELANKPVVTSMLNKITTIVELINAGEIPEAEGAKFRNLLVNVMRETANFNPASTTNGIISDLVIAAATEGATGDKTFSPKTKAICRAILSALESKSTDVFSVATQVKINETVRRGETVGGIESVQMAEQFITKAAVLNESEGSGKASTYATMAMLLLALNGKAQAGLIGDFINGVKQQIGAQVGAEISTAIEGAAKDPVGFAKDVYANTQEATKQQASMHGQQIVPPVTQTSPTATPDPKDAEEDEDEKAKAK